MKKLLFLVLLALGMTATASPQSFLFLTGPATEGGGGEEPAAGIIDSLTSGSVTAATSMDINFSAWASNYRVIFIKFSAIPSAGSASLICQVSTNGTTFDHGSANYDWWDNYGGSVNNASDTCMQILGALGAGTGARTVGTIEIDDINSTTYYPQVYGQVAGLGSQIYNSLFSGRRLTGQVTKGIRIRFGGSITITGYYYVYGMH